jgi:hypothetical protein
MYRRYDFDKTSGYNESMDIGFEDWDFWLSFIKDESEVYKIPETLFSYRIKLKSRNSSLDIEKQRSIRRQIFNNHKEIYNSFLNTSDLIFEYYLLINKFETLSKSPDFVLGKTMLAPFRFLKRRLNK